ncbi:MAG: putative metal-binding motif-containing protein [Myxococcota bacterium]
MWWLMWMAIPEIPYDGIDQDGDGRDLVDLDGDGEPSVLAFGRDCNDRDPAVHPRARDVRGDHVDSDCDGSDGPRARWPWAQIPRIRRPSSR